jgi:hypothetical protein
MNFFGEINFGANTADFRVGMFAIAGLAVYGIWSLLRWLSRGPKTPDPWNDEVAAEIEGLNATPLCPHCLARHGELEHFCPDCGGPVGAYTNLMPFPYLFSVGHMLRIGTSGTFKDSRFLITGFFLFAIAEYAVLAPVYWWMLLKNVTRLRSSNQSEAQPPVSKPG